ncbi:MAG: IS630 family transposase [Holophaga sp.]|nr:IS630 family transposase [Holophaga sp.]
MKKKKKEATPKEQRRYEIRRAVVEAVQRGDPVAVVARVCGVAVRSIFDWLAWYRQGGWQALKEGRRSGRPRKVSGEVMRWLYRAITMGNPLQYQFEFCLWTLAIIRQMLRREHGIELSKSAVSRLLAQMGLSPQRPIYRSYKQRPRELRRFLKETFPGLQKLARRTGAVIFFVDEASVRSDAHRGTTWGKIGETPVVQDSGDRFSLRLISAVTLRGDMRFAAFEGSMTGPRFVEFIEKLRRDVKRPLIIIADNASYHRSQPLKDYVASSQGQVVVENLPRYAPELNPDEQVWNQAKSRLGKLFVTSKKEMKRAVLNIMRSIQRNCDLIQSFFQLPDTKYAS